MRAICSLPSSVVGTWAAVGTPAPMGAASPGGMSGSWSAALSEMSSWLGRHLFGGAGGLSSSSVAGRVLFLSLLLAGGRAHVPLGVHYIYASSPSNVKVRKVRWTAKMKKTNKRIKNGSKDWKDKEYILRHGEQLERKSLLERKLRKLGGGRGWDSC
ncbi:hypothetical protein B0H65DRAFT_143774 [Neurospora tetraspora]|uniref:Uncharacterized protein n=1 Tax=Neurospora tetraspora TaxID=94610 RepID=A0AAE0JMC9_9PEZI|nr:hypothetical protein B0H65DRAFT_143774 [Neurospora tetraspora]